MNPPPYCLAILRFKSRLVAPKLAKPQARHIRRIFGTPLSMGKMPIAALMVAALIGPSTLTAGTPFNKCNINGSVTYQHDPCPSSQVHPRPTVEQLNAERQKSLNQQKEQPAQPSPTSVEGQRQQPRGTASSASESGATYSGELQKKNRPAVTTLSFKCDSRKYCSQMTSCAEATYFLANCPGVKMDGDKNGVPCEKQWCTR